MHAGLGQRYLDAWNTHEGEAVAAFMAPDVDFEEVTLGERLAGRAEVAGFVERFTATFSSDYRFELVSELVTADAFAAEWVVSGTHDRGSPALPATNERFTIRGATIARLDGELITYNRDYWDMAGFLREVGVLPSG